jgi:hypothetical protein
LAVWFSPDTKQAKVDCFNTPAGRETAGQWKTALATVLPDVTTEAGRPTNEAGWTRLVTRTLPALRFCEKQAADPAVKKTLQWLGYLPGKLPGSPSPLIATLSSSLLGAGLGYGAGKAINWLAPETKEWSLTPRLAIYGGLAGAAPGAGWMLANLSKGLPVNSGELMAGEHENLPSERYRFLSLPDLLQKRSSFGFDLQRHPDFGFNPEEFNTTVWEDPRVASRLDNSTQAAASGLVTGAAHLRGSPRWVTPADIGRVAAGMGSGFVSGALVGKALGVLLGMPQSTQNRLKQTGQWAGIVSNLVPLAFGAR